MKKNNPYGEIFFGEKAPLKKEQILFKKKKQPFGKKNFEKENKTQFFVKKQLTTQN